MILEFEEELLNRYEKKGGKNKVVCDVIKQMKEHRKNDRYYYSRDRNINSDFLTVEDLDFVIQIITETPELTREAEQRRTLRKMRAVRELKFSGGKKTVNLEVMVEALREYIRPLPHHWVFTEDETGQFLPWHVDRIQFHSAYTSQGCYHPAHVDINLRAKARGSERKKTIHFEREHLGTGKDAGGLLTDLHIFVESEDLVQKYTEEMETYEDFISMNGEQFLAVGKGKLGFTDQKDGDRWYRWNRDWVDFMKLGEPTRVIMDDGVQFGEKGADEQVYVSSHWWVTGEDDDEVEQEQENQAPVTAPVHPYAVVFSLKTHEFASIHTSNLTPYQYDTTISDKLVLPKDHRHLIDVLIHTKHKDAEDIVRGKKGGVIILCSGAPGTGKTLTAEVYAEIAERPLYVVQCAQLGIKADDLEGELSIVLQRSMRWNAIVLLDEADVYIHERGNDVNQNAIVGVFLRLLEYYAGVMFLTTNRATIVDDAIHSRCLAHVRYKVANEHDRRKIWKILSKQYGVQLGSELLDQLVEIFPTISGRNIKQLCRLTQSLGEEPTLEKFKWLASFQDGIEVKGESNG